MGLPVRVQRTQVVHVKEGFDVYIGRPMPGHSGSEFANPFRRGVDGTKTEVIAKYEAHIVERLAKDPDLRAALQLLKGRRIGCWCKPASCHGDVLARLLDGPAELPLQLDLF